MLVPLKTNAEITGAILLYLQERGYQAEMFDNEWQISVRTDGINPVVCVVDDEGDGDYEIEVNIDYRVEYLGIADPECFTKLEKWIDFAAEHKLDNYQAHTGLWEGETPAGPRTVF